MAKWRNRFNKGDRFQKLDDNDDDVEDDDVDFRGHEITPTFSTSTTMVMSSAPTTANSNVTLEKEALLQTPSSKKQNNTGKPLNYTMSSPETTASTVITTPRASPVSVSSNSSSQSDDSQNNHNSRNNDSFDRDSTIATGGAGQRKSVMELDGIINNKKGDKDDVEIYEAEDSSASYHYSETQDDVTKQAVAATTTNPFEDDEEKKETATTNHRFDDDDDAAEDKKTTTNPFDDDENPVNTSRSSGPVDLDESFSSSPVLEDDGDDNKSVKSLEAPSIQSHATDGSEDIYEKDEKFAVGAAAKPQTPSPDRSAEDSAKSSSSSNPSPVKSLVQSFNKKAGAPPLPAPKRTSSLNKPSIVGRAQSTPIIRPPPNKPRPIPVPVPTSTPTDSSLTDSYKNKNANSNVNNNSSRRGTGTIGSKHSNSKGGSHHDDDDDEDTPIEIHGIDLLEERDHSVSELQEMSHLMTFNALILIQKQKDWLEGSSQKAKATRLMFELENMERKIKLLSDHREWPNETERQKQRKDPLTPSKAFFKAMSLLDRSIEQFHQGYLSFTATKSQENHELKRSMEQLQSKNSALLTEMQTVQHSLQHLENERNDLAKQVKQMEKHLSLVQVKQEEDFDDGTSTAMTDVCANNGTFLSKIFNIKSYIESLEEQQRKHVEEIEELKKKVVVEEDENKDDKDATEEQDAELQRAGSGDSGFMGDDLGSRWHTLEQNEVATEKAADLERQVQELCVKLADREQDLTSLRAECKLIRMQLLQEERTRNEFKTQLAEKDSALSVAEQRIANLEEEVLKTHARCATYEEDYAALKDSYATQKEATLQELGASQEETKAQMEKIQSDYEVKLTTLEESLSTEKSERERLVRDLKTALEEMETERDQLKAKITEQPAAYDGEEKKEAESVSAADVEKMKKLEEELKQFERMRERLAEKACAQATTIATLTEANENKEAQLNSLQEMIEMLLQEREAHDNTTANQMKQRMSSLRDKMREKAAQVKEQVQDRSSHGGVFGSQHG